MIHTFADCELDEELFQLRRRGRVIKLEPKVFDVLAYLLRHRDRVVSKDELLDAVWPGQAVSESVLPKCVAAARRGVGDFHGRWKVIATVHGRGYRFIAPVNVDAPAPTASQRARVGKRATRTGDAKTTLTPFVGRDRALASLRSGLERTRAGCGRVVLLVGEPGIGKTRMTEELAAEAHRQQIPVLVGRCYEGEGAPAFWPWVQILRACLASSPSYPVRDGPGAADVAALVPELRERLAGARAKRQPAGAGRAIPGGAALADDTPSPADFVAQDQQARFRLFDGVTAFLKHAAAAQPLVVVIDDLHWADEASLRLLGFVAGEARDSPLLIVATYRDVDVRRGHPLEDLLATLAREPQCERIALRGLEKADVARFIENLSGAAPPPELVAAVVEMTEGNPFFIQEIVRLLASEIPLVSTEGFEQKSVGQGWMLAVPQSLRAAIGRRLGRLSPACDALLRTASVLGREFSGAILARLASLPHERVVALIHEAAAARIIDPIPDELDRYAFHHALIRQTLYEELTVPQRVLVHRRAGEVLEEALGGHPDASLPELAHHFVQAAPGGDVRKAVDLCARAAARAFEQLAYEESARWYERALQALDLELPRDEERRGELLLALGEAWSVSGARARARATFEVAADVARRLARPDLLARAALGYRGAAEMGVPAEPATLALLEEAIGALGDREHGLRARLLSRLVGTPPHSNSMENRAALAREAHALARATGDPLALRDALSARLWACLGPDGIDERLAVARELLELAGRQSDQRLALLGHDGMLGGHLLRGDMEAAQRALAAYGRIAHDLRQPAFVFQATFWKGSWALGRGELDEAERLFREAMTLGRGTVPYAHFMYAGQMSSILYRRAVQADPVLTVFFDEMLALPYSFEYAVRSSLALAHAIAGDLDACRREFEGLAERGFANLRRDEHWLIALGVLSELAVRLDDRLRGAQLYDLLEPYAGLVSVHDLLRSTGGTVASSLGDLATLLGRDDQAVAYYEQAIVEETAMGIVPALLDSYGGYCRFLFLRGRAADKRRAEQMLAETEARAAALGIIRYRHCETLRQ